MKLFFLQILLIVSFALSWGGGLLQAKSIFVESPFEHQSNEPFGVQLEAQSYSSSSIQPVREVMGQWHGEFRKEPTEVFSLTELYKGGRYHGLELGYVERLELFVNGDSDFSEVYYRSRVGKNFPLGKTYRAEGRLYGYEFKGWRVGYQFQIQQFQMVLRGSRIEGKQTQDIDLKADIEVLSSKEYSINATAEHRYTENLLYDQRIKSSRGEGYTFDFYGTTSFSPQWDFFLAVKDWGGHLEWKDLPYGDIEGTNDIVRSGTKVKAAVEGVEREENHKQALITKISTNSTYYFNSAWGVSGTVDSYVGRVIPSLDLLYRLNTFKLSTGYNFNFKTLGVAISHPCCFFKVESDDIDLGKSYTQGLAAGVSLNF